MDPSYGGCAMLRVALDELGQLGAAHPPSMIYGADIDGATAEWAAHLVSQGVPSSQLHAADFLSIDPGGQLPVVDAVVGNPPYVRHHLLPAAAKSRAVASAARAGVALSGRASLWAFFVIHAARFVRPGGRMAMLLPGAVLQADYAPQVTDYLEQHFDDVEFVRVLERVFTDASEETVVLLATKSLKPVVDRTPVRISEVDDLVELAELLEQDRRAELIPHPSMDGVAPWKVAKISARVADLLHSVMAASNVQTLGDVARIGLGTVTGSNSTFVLSASEVERLQVSEWTVPVVSRAHWLTGPAVTTSSLELSRGKGPQRLLVLPPEYRLDRRTRIGRHLTSAEALGVHLRHHCQRDPWWSIGKPTAPDAFLPYTVATPRGMSINLAGAASTNTVHQVMWKNSDAADQQRSWAMSSWSILGQVSTELYGRHYGGGVLKTELSAARRLPVVSDLVVDDDTWAACQNDQQAAQHAADEALLRCGLNLSRDDLEALSALAGELARQRAGRRPGRNRPDHAVACSLGLTPTAAGSNK